MNFPLAQRHTPVYMQWLPYLFVIGAAVPLALWRDFTPANELRYISIADEALRQGDIMAFTNHGIPYADKPPLYIWLCMLMRLIAGEHLMAALQMFSLIPALLTTAVMSSWTHHLPTDTPRDCAPWMLLTSAFFFGLTVTLRMDMLMTLFIVLALRSFYLIYKYKREEKARLQQWLFPIWIFLAVFTKGPLGIMIPLVSTVVFLIAERRLSTIGRYWGWRTWIILIVLCGAWFAGVAIDGGTAYLDNLLFHQTVGRAVDAFHHKRPFYYYAIAIWYSMAPWSLMIAALIAVAATRHIIQSPLEKLFLTVILTTFVMLSFISSKIQVYLLPLFPFAAYLSSFYIHRLQNNVIVRIFLSLPAVIFFISPAALLHPAAERFVIVPVIAATAVLCIGGLIALICTWKRRLMPAAVRSIGISMMTAVCILGYNITNWNADLGYGEAARAAGAAVAPGGKIISWQIERGENMDVYTGCEITQIHAACHSDSVHFAPGDVVIFKTDSIDVFAGKGLIRKYGPRAILICNDYD